MKEPDETLITRWFDGELEGEELREIEAWADANPELAAEFESWQSLRSGLRQAIPGEMEVPHGEFFRHRIAHEIERDELAANERSIAEEVEAETISRRFWLPISAAAAALVIGFLGGTKLGDEAPVDTAGLGQSPDVVAPVLFTPDEAVSVELVDSSEATLILLEGVQKLPDTTELSALVTKEGRWFAAVERERELH